MRIWDTKNTFLSVPAPSRTSLQVSLLPLLSPPHAATAGPQRCDVTPVQAGTPGPGWAQTCPGPGSGLELERRPLLPKAERQPVVPGGGVISRGVLGEQREGLGCSRHWGLQLLPLPGGFAAPGTQLLCLCPGMGLSALGRGLLSGLLGQLSCEPGLSAIVTCVSLPRLGGLPMSRVRPERLASLGSMRSP